MASLATATTFASTMETAVRINRNIVKMLTYCNSYWLNKNCYSTKALTNLKFKIIVQFEANMAHKNVGSDISSEKEEDKISVPMHINLIYCNLYL